MTTIRSMAMVSACVPQGGRSRGKGNLFPTLTGVCNAGSRSPRATSLSRALEAPPTDRKCARGIVGAFIEGEQVDGRMSGIASSLAHVTKNSRDPRIQDRAAAVAVMMAFVKNERAAGREVSGCDGLLKGTESWLGTTTRMLDSGREDGAVSFTGRDDSKAASRQWFAYGKTLDSVTRANQDSLDAFLDEKVIGPALDAAIISGGGDPAGRDLWIEGASLKAYEAIKQTVRDHGEAAASILHSLSLPHLVKDLDLARIPENVPERPAASGNPRPDSPRGPYSGPSGEPHPAPRGHGDNYNKNANRTGDVIVKMPDSTRDTTGNGCSLSQKLLDALQATHDREVELAWELGFARGLLSVANRERQPDDVPLTTPPNPPPPPGPGPLPGPGAGSSTLMREMQTMTDPVTSRMGTQTHPDDVPLTTPPNPPPPPGLGRGLESGPGLGAGNGTFMREMQTMTDPVTSHMGTQTHPDDVPLTTPPNPPPPPGPGPIPGPIPDPIPGPNPDPIPGPNPNPIPGPNPDPIPGPNPDPIPGPNPDPIPGPNPDPIPGPGPQRTFPTWNVWRHFTSAAAIAKNKRSGDDVLHSAKTVVLTNGATSNTPGGTSLTPPSGSRRRHVDEPGGAT